MAKRRQKKNTFKSEVKILGVPIHIVSRHLGSKRRGGEAARKTRRYYV